MPLEGCRHTLEHVAGDLMHTVCIEVFAKISLDLPLGGWLGDHLVIMKMTAVIAVIIFFIGHTNAALMGL